VGLKAAVVIPVAHTIPIHAQNQFGSLSRPHGVPVNADDSGDGAAVGFHVGRAVVGFTRDAVVMVIIKPGNAGIIPQNRDHPIFFRLNLEGRRFNAGLKEAVDGLPSPLWRSW
jgi:hypothetical protein